MMTMMFFFKSNLLLQSWLLRFEPMKIHVRSASLWLFIVMKRVCLRERERVKPGLLCLCCHSVKVRHLKTEVKKNC